MSILSDISGFAEMRGIRADGGGGASSSSSTAENMRCDAAQYGFFGKAPMEELELGSLLEDGGVNGDGSGFGEPDDGGYQFSSVGEEDDIIMEWAQTVGMGAEAQSIPAAAKLFDKANDILGYDLLDLCTNGPKEKLDSTVISQPAIYVTSLAAVEVLRACDGGQDVINSVDVTCGLSLGEYTALAFAGAFSFEDGLKLVKLRGEAIQDASDAANSAMIKRLFPIRMAYES